MCKEKTERQIRTKVKLGTCTPLSIATVLKSVSVMCVERRESDKIEKPERREKKNIDIFWRKWRLYILSDQEKTGKGKISKIRLKRILAEIKLNKNIGIKRKRVKEWWTYKNSQTKEKFMQEKDVKSKDQKKIR